MIPTSLQSSLCPCIKGAFAVFEGIAITSVQWPVRLVAGRRVLGSKFSNSCSKLIIQISLTGTPAPEAIPSISCTYCG
jgi:hypothetical protein